VNTTPTEQRARAEDRDGQFLALLGQHEARLAACVHAMIPGWQDAEDVLQETKVTLWREFASFQPGTDFLAWAQQVARYQARSFMRQRQRQRLMFSDELFDVLLEQFSYTPEEEDRRRIALMECAKRIGNRGCELFRLRYGERRKIKDVAAEPGRSVAGVYGALSRLRRRLAECLENRSRAEDHL